MATNVTYLRDAANIFKGELADNNEALKLARDARNGSLWNILCHLVCHASIVVFDKDYSRVKAKRFKEDVMGSFGISEKQAGKWTEAISAGLGVRGTRKGVQPIEGLSVAARDGVAETQKFLKAKEIETFNQFMTATRTPKDDVQELAKKYHNLSEAKRARLLKLVEKLDKDEDGTDDDTE